MTIEGSRLPPYPRGPCREFLGAPGAQETAIRTQRGTLGSPWSGSNVLERPSASNVTIFDFKRNRVRVTLIDGEPWFVAADVCRALFINYNTEAGAYPYTQHLRTDEKRTAHRSDPSTHGLFMGTSGGSRLMLISESGLYKLILRSNKPEAVEFQDWVTREVLPAIRKTGGYMLKGSDRDKIAEGTTEEFRMPKDFAGAFEPTAKLARQPTSARAVGGESRQTRGCPSGAASCPPRSAHNWVASASAPGRAAGSTKDARSCGPGIRRCVHEAGPWAGAAVFLSRRRHHS